MRSKGVYRVHICLPAPGAKHSWLLFCSGWLMSDHELGLSWAQPLISCSREDCNITFLTHYCCISYIQRHWKLCHQGCSGCLFLKACRQLQAGLGKSLEGFRILPVKCAHVNTPPVWQETISFSVSSSFGRRVDFWNLSPLILLLVQGDKEVISCFKPSLS